MNHPNSRHFLTLIVVLSLSSNTFSVNVNETTTSVSQTEQSAQTDTTSTELSPITTKVKHGNHSTTHLISQARSSKAAPTVPHFRSSPKEQQNVNKTAVTAATIIKTTPNKSWPNRPTEHSPSSATKSENRKPSKKTFTILVIVLPILSLVLILLVVRVICFNRSKKQILDDDVTSENVASPIFEEDIHSVMEVEMDEVEKWMGSIKKPSQQETLLEEKELNPKSRGYYLLHITKEQERSKE